MSSRGYLAVLVACMLAAPLAGQELPANPDEVHPRKSEAPKAPARGNRDLSPDPDKIQTDHPIDQGESSSRDTRIDPAPPSADVREHPDSYNELKPWNPHKADKDVEVGDYYFKRKNYRAAESRYREALYWEDNNAAATYKLAMALEKLGEVEEAAHNYRAYPKLAPEGPYAADARAALKRLAPELGPTPGTPRTDQGEDDLRLGEFYMALGNWPGAAERFRDALELKPDDAVAAFRLAQCLEQMKKGGEARGYYEEYVKLLPNGPFAATAREGMARAPAEPEKPVTDESKLARVEDQLRQGEESLEKKDYRAAVGQLRSALKDSPENGRGWFRLAQALEGEGERDEALRAYREYLRVDPNGPFAIDSLNALNRLGRPRAAATSSPGQNPQ